MRVSAISITGWDGCKTCYDPFSTNEINSIKKKYSNYIINIIINLIILKT